MFMCEILTLDIIILKCSVVAPHSLPRKQRPQTSSLLEIYQQQQQKPNNNTSINSNNNNNNNNNKYVLEVPYKISMLLQEENLKLQK